MRLLYLTMVLGLCTGSKKKGVCMLRRNHQCGDLDILDGISWYYNWISHWEPGCNDREGYIPMLWRKHYDPPPHLDYPIVLGFNEPNHSKHGNMSGKHAAEAWIKIQKVYGDKVLVSPAVAHMGDVVGDAFQWLDEFFARCEELGGCRVDYLATHSYMHNVDHSMDYLHSLYKRYNIKIWLTEFARSKTEDEDDVLEFMEDMLYRLEEADYIDRYAWFLARWPTEKSIIGDETKKDWYLSSVNSLFKYNSSELTAVGRLYNTYKQRSNKPMI